MSKMSDKYEQLGKDMSEMQLDLLQKIPCLAILFAIEGMIAPKLGPLRHSGGLAFASMKT